MVRTHGFCGKTADPARDAIADVAAARTIETAGIDDSPWGEQAWIMLRVFPPIRELTGAFRLPPLKNLFLPGMEEGSGCSSAAIAFGEERRRFSQDVALYCHSRQFRARTADLRLLLAQLRLAPGASQLAITIRLDPVETRYYSNPASRRILDTITIWRLFRLSYISRPYIFRPDDPCHILVLTHHEAQSRGTPIGLVPRRALVHEYALLACVSWAGKNSARFAEVII